MGIYYFVRGNAGLDLFYFEKIAEDDGRKTLKQNTVRLTAFVAFFWCDSATPGFPDVWKKVLDYFVIYFGQSPLL